MSIWWSLHLRREAASVPLARRLLLGTMETAGVDPDISYDLSIALSEACANAVEHGGAAEWGAGAGEYHVTAHIEGDRCRIEVTDSGPGFSRSRARRALRPLVRRAAHHQEGGRGLFLIESLVDHVDFRNRPGRGVVVSFDKVLKWRDDSLLKAS
ncbi:ATP-binding protein [Streptomyces sp. RB6PN25]|uniref:ATP-binding protein n=1 Tax=Streptomyces humicola TaxID=2953240 RepID=A0ABT1PZT7_9ACTN|nr:ATP-binding protein [Streptomyces humicola]MCQ4083172.1 ATP-binding protein [Streptomyces humicola]